MWVWVRDVGPSVGVYDPKIDHRLIAKIYHCSFAQQLGSGIGLLRSYNVVQSQNRVVQCLVVRPPGLPYACVYELQIIFQFSVVV